jgi:hypothetical protein
MYSVKLHVEVQYIENRFKMSDALEYEFKL